MKENKSYLILTIDDEEAIRYSFRDYLEDYNYSVIEAENGERGLELVKQQKPDLILLDLSMPGMSGIDVLKKIHEIEEEIPVIVISGTGLITDVIDALRNGAWDFMVKPVIVISGTGLITDVIDALRNGAWDFMVKPVEDLKFLIHSVNKCLERVKLLQENKKYQNQLEEMVA